jgi:hypothetical protein
MCENLGIRIRKKKRRREEQAREEGAMRRTCRRNGHVVRSVREAELKRIRDEHRNREGSSCRKL